ncbi:MAG: hypothetical protein WA510_32960 [Acidobacteriaceae bacterium]
MNEVNVILAKHSGLGRVCLCECNSVHVSVGPVTLNLEQAAFMQMVTLLGNAAEQLSEILKARQTSESPFQSPECSPSRMTH